MTNQNPAIEIVHEASGSIVVCDRLSHCVACDDGLAEEVDDILAALGRGEDYMLGGGAAAGFIVRLAPANAIVLPE